MKMNELIVTNGKAILVKNDSFRVLNKIVGVISRKYTRNNRYNESVKK